MSKFPVSDGPAPKLEACRNFPPPKLSPDEMPPLPPAKSALIPPPSFIRSTPPLPLYAKAVFPPGEGCMYTCVCVHICPRPPLPNILSVTVECVYHCPQRPGPDSPTFSPPSPPKQNTFGPTERQNEHWREANRRRQRQTTEALSPPPPPATAAASDVHRAQGVPDHRVSRIGGAPHVPRCCSWRCRGVGQTGAGGGGGGMHRTTHERQFCDPHRRVSRPRAPAAGRSDGSPAPLPPPPVCPSICAGVCPSHVSCGGGLGSGPERGGGGGICIKAADNRRRRRGGTP